MEDYEYDDGESMLNDYQASIVFSFLLAIASIAFIIVFIIIGTFNELLEAKPFTTIGLLSVYWVAFFLGSYIAIKINYNKVQKEKSNREFRLNKQMIEKSPILYVGINNQQGEYKGHICPICNEAINENLKIAACPQCKTVFHLNHLLEWVEKNDCCLVCNYRLKK